jgi:hypothetical protein
MLMNNTLYQAPGDEDAGAFPESSTYESHFPEAQYGLDGQAALTADSPQYDLNLEQ